MDTRYSVYIKSTCLPEFYEFMKANNLSFELVSLTTGNYSALRADIDNSTMLILKIKFQGILIYPPKPWVPPAYEELE